MEGTPGTGRAAEAGATIASPRRTISGPAHPYPISGGPVMPAEFVPAAEPEPVPSGPGRLGGGETAVVITAITARSPRC
ncbi:hypothetical protein ACH4Y0_02990 [Streptomyces sp. NPDC020707]|uniref:hypothetical protein n=1 Tax=Streptomyces sp. NPDC020707 TaxID=3365084 RepID=UPI0037A28F79